MGLKLRPYQPEDSKYIVSWITDETTYYSWCAGLIGTYPLSKEQLENYYDIRIQKGGDMPMTAYDENGVAGHVLLRYTDEANKVLRLGFVIIDKDIRGKGYGKEMVSLAAQYGFEKLLVNEVTLGVFKRNLPAYHCYKSIGFEEGRSESRTKYQIGREEWECIELSLEKEKYIAG